MMTQSLIGDVAGPQGVHGETPPAAGNEANGSTVGCYQAAGLAQGPGLAPVPGTGAEPGPGIVLCGTVTAEVMQELQTVHGHALWLPCVHSRGQLVQPAWVDHKAVVIEPDHVAGGNRAGWVPEHLTHHRILEAVLGVEVQLGEGQSLQVAHGLRAARVGGHAQVNTAGWASVENRI